MAFGDKDNEIPLQAADVLVGLVARDYKKAREKNAPLEEVMEKSLQMLGKSGPLLVTNAGPVEPVPDPRNQTMDGIYVGPNDLGIAMGMAAGTHRQEPEFLRTN